MPGKERQEYFNDAQHVNKDRGVLFCGFSKLRRLLEKHAEMYTMKHMSQPRGPA